MKKPTFDWNEKEGTAICFIEDRGRTYYGVATCSPEDRDLMSEKTGCEIAYLRASIMGLRAVRDEIKHELNALRKYYYSMNTSKYFDSESYPIRQLVKKMDQLEQDYSVVKSLAQDRYKELTNYISKKGDFYKKIRANRKKAE